MDSATDISDFIQGVVEMCEDCIAVSDHEEAEQMLTKDERFLLNCIVDGYNIARHYIAQRAKWSIEDDD